MASCGKIEELSPIPSIRYTSFAVFDSVDQLGNSQKAGKLKFYFEDGDGDLGSTGDGLDTLKNMFISLYKKSNGSMVISTDTLDPLLPYSFFRIPYMERLGQNKILKGTISVTFLYLYYPIERNDTIQYEFYIRDRASNSSNSVLTGEIAVSFNKIYTK